jgi:iron complex outermembrane receptor protein
MKKTLLLLLFISASFHVLAQSVKGKISDEKNGTPLPGVSILVQGTNTGTVTDADGNFTLNMADGLTTS